MSELTELQEQKKILDAIIAFGDKAERLENNADFKDVILEGYCVNEMKRCMSLAVAEKADPSLRELALQMAKSAATLENFLALLKQQSAIAKGDLEEVSNSILELETKGEEE